MKGKTKRFRARIDVVELERGDMAVVAAKRATPSCLANEKTLDLPAPLQDGLLSALHAPISAIRPPFVHHLPMVIATEHYTSRTICTLGLGD